MPWKPVETPADLIGKHETSTFDWKQTYDFAKDTTPFEVAKDVAAFASALGGTILIGAIEGKEVRKGKVAAFKSVSDPGDLVAKVSNAVNQRSRPLPVFEPKVIELDGAAQALILERELGGDVDVVTVVAINVQPLPSGPVGVLTCDKDGKAIGDAWRFPIRSGEGTRLLKPEEFALYMNAHERKIGLQLHAIPTTTIRVFDDHNRQTNLVREIVRIDDEHMMLVLAMEGMPGSQLRAHVPFTFIRAVWKDELDVWSIFVEGYVFENFEAERPKFVPTRR